MEEKEKGGFTPQKGEDEMDWLEERRRIYTIHRLQGFSEEKADAMALREIQKRAEKAGYPRERIYRREETDKKISEPNEKSEELSALIKRDYDKLDSVYVRIVNASDDLKVLVKELSQGRGSIATWYILGNAQEEMELSLKGIEKILYGEVE